ncbi:cupin domain-containing protein [Streptomyces sp. C11-1]|uniref:Cupin domain-containing protein n=1 Tax=Streptomyces durocortorensis TaxID=2811104 RepID=A0ABY9W588_9ACTN|nr:cupin domain-containing protein [Streptomyces durocortorensis]WNF31339.1 cupin domain-containing protein [Streptomyces durocortorensis]
MSSVKVAEEAAALPRAWSSAALARVGTASVKVLRMDGLPVEEERHTEPEVLLVLDGRLELTVDGGAVTVGPGEMYVVGAGVAHAVRPGSRGTLVIVERSCGTLDE